ncbi:MAG: hypothetical protein J6X95_01495, partial [Treponema sp.]|nr:hypothetical protein [Treponema sp.]
CNDSGSFEMKDGAVITQNSANDGLDGSLSSGGGIFVYGGSVTVSGGTISANTTNGLGGAVRVFDGAFSVGGSANIPCGTGNDVYLDEDQSIAIASALNSNFAATVVLSDYEINTVVLTGTESLLSSECYKFYAPKPDAAEEHLFVLDDGKLGPIVTYPNGTSDGTETKDGLTYTVMKYSFKNYDNLQMNVPSAYTDNGFVELKVDGSVPENAAILDDGYHTVSFTLPKYTSEPIVIEKLMHVKIKPIRLLYQNLEWGQIGAQYVCFANWVTGRVHIRGQVKVNGTTIFDCQSYNYEVDADAWYNLDWEMTGRKFDHTFSSKTDELSLFFNIWRNADTPGTAGAHTITRTLADIKKVNVSKCGSGTSDSVENWCLWSENQTNPSGAPSPTIAVKVKFNTYE